LTARVAWLALRIFIASRNWDAKSGRRRRRSVRRERDARVRGSARVEHGRMRRRSRYVLELWCPANSNASWFRPTEGIRIDARERARSTSSTPPRTRPSFRFCRRGGTLAV